MIYVTSVSHYHVVWRTDESSLKIVAKILQQDVSPESRPSDFPFRITVGVKSSMNEVLKAST